MEHRLRLTRRSSSKTRSRCRPRSTCAGLVAGDLAPSFQDLGWQGRSNATARTPAVRLPPPVRQVPPAFGVFEFGQMPSDWGMGMLVNGGNQEEGRTSGRPLRRHRRSRAVRHPPVRVPRAAQRDRPERGAALAADVIYRDRYARLVNESATNGLRWATWPRSCGRAGVGSRSGLARRRVRGAPLAAVRAGGGSLHTWLVDLHAHLFPIQWLGGTVSLEVEVAEVYGNTTHAPNLSALFRTQVAQQGAVARALLSRGTLEAELEAGYASGDSNPFDDASPSSSSAAISRWAWCCSTSAAVPDAERGTAACGPQLLGAAPPGVDLLPTEARWRMRST